MQQPKIGDDVTKLMQKPPEIGDDVTALMKGNETKKEETYTSRVKKDIGGLGSFISTVFRAGLGDQIALQEGIKGASQPFEELVKNRNTALLPNIGENIARFSTGMAGIDYDALDQDIQSKNLPAVLGDLTVPLAAGALLHKIGGAKGLSKEIPRVDVLPKDAPIPLAKEVKQLPSGFSPLGNGPKALLNEGKITPDFTNKLNKDLGSSAGDILTDNIITGKEGVVNKPVNPNFFDRTPTENTAAKVPEPKIFTSNDIRAQFKMEPSQAIKKGLVEYIDRNQYKEVNLKNKDYKDLNSTQTIKKLSNDLTMDDFLSNEMNAGIDPFKSFNMLRDKLGNRPRVPYTGQWFSERLRNSPQGDIIRFIQNAKPLVAKQDLINRTERAKKFSSFDAIKSTGEQRTIEMFGRMKGEHPKVGFEPIVDKFTPEQIDDFHSQIHNSELDKGNQLTALNGLKKILNPDGSQLPVPSEMKQLAKVFGKDFTNSIIELHAGIPLPILSRNMIVDAINAPKSAVTGLDLSAPLRQGALLMHQPSFWKSLGPMAKAFVSEDAAKGYETALKSDPIYELVNPIDGKYDIGITEITKDYSRADLLRREEQYASQLAHKYIPWVQLSERSFSTFLNRLRFDTFKSILTDSKKAGIELSPEYVGRIADYVKNATGRGSLGSLEKIAPELNATFFSPKFVSSRIHMLNPKNYLEYAKTPADAMVRKQYLKSALSLVSATATTYMIGKLLSNDATVSNEPLSTDLGKLKIDDTRLDPFAGLQQPLVAGLRALSNKSTDVNGKTTEYKGMNSRITPLARFTRSKLSPTAAFVFDMLDGKDITGKKFEANSRTMNMFIPLIVNDLYELAKQDPKLMMELAPLKIFGMSGNTFNKTNIGDDVFGHGKK